MVEISLSGSGEGPGRATGRGYSTTKMMLSEWQISRWRRGWLIQVKVSRSGAPKFKGLNDLVTLLE
mgnify:FL=1